MARVTIYTDGAARGNPGPSASGYMIYDSKEELLAGHSEYNGVKTNNFAEYSAVLHALEWCAENLDAKSMEIDLYSDSELVVKQLNGHYKIKAPHIKELNEKVKGVKGRFRSVIFRNLPRENPYIKAVDRSLNKLLDGIEKDNKE